MDSDQFPSRVGQLRRSARSLSRLTTSSMDLKTIDPMDEGIYAIPFLWAWRKFQRHRVDKRLPATDCDNHVLAAYATAGQTVLHPWPGRVSRCGDQIIFCGPGGENEIDLSEMSFDAYCDGIAWVDVRHGREVQLTLAIYASSERVLAVLGVRCPQQAHDSPLN